MPKSLAIARLNLVQSRDRFFASTVPSLSTTKILVIRLNEQQI
ncbi:hypothetical protein AB3R30_22395 [Leptolyngbyaceae cyanobacterium UHCC 1019]